MVSFSENVVFFQMYVCTVIQPMFPILMHRFLYLCSSSIQRISPLKTCISILDGCRWVDHPPTSPVNTGGEMFTLKFLQCVYIQNFYFQYWMEQERAETLLRNFPKNSSWENSLHFQTWRQQLRDVRLVFLLSLLNGILKASGLVTTLMFQFSYPSLPQ